MAEVSFGGETAGNMAISPGTAPGDHAACDAEIGRLRQSLGYLAAELGEARSEAAMTSFAEAQRRAWANKAAKGFNTTDVPMEFGLLMEELGEAFSAWRKGKSGYGGELADVAIFLLGLAEMTDIDLGTEVAVKLDQNEERAYVRLPNGTPVKAEAGHA